MSKIKKATGVKHDGEKPRMELLSNIAQRSTATVLTFGAREYGADNWREGIVWRRLLGACGRHLAAFNDGEDIDPDSGLPHIDHLACEVMFLQEQFRTRKDLDDRHHVQVTAPEPEHAKAADDCQCAITHCAGHQEPTIRERPPFARQIVAVPASRSKSARK